MYIEEKIVATLGINVTDEEKAEVEKEAEAQNISVSAYLRQKIGLPLNTKFWHLGYRVRKEKEE